MDGKRLVLYVNGVRVEDTRVSPKCTLAVYLRTTLNLTGTKIGCAEGGCGACTVMVSECGPEGHITHYSVVACLFPVLQCHLKAVTTIEGIGNHIRPHVIQQRLAAAHASQCGFCTPGFAMAMYALLRNHPNPTKKQIHNAIQGNLCRCTGYRPILEAFYTFAEDHTKLKDSVPAKAGCGGCVNGQQCCKNTSDDRKTVHGIIDRTEFNVPYDPTQEPIFPPELKKQSQDHFYEPFTMCHQGVSWHRISTLQKLLQFKHKTPTAKLVFGNTEIALEQSQRGITYLNLLGIRSIPDLKTVTQTESAITIGAGFSLSEMQNLLENAKAKLKEYQCGVINAVLDMMHWFAGVHVRNIATFAGNIATASPISDLNQVWLAANAVLHLRSTTNSRTVVMDETFFVRYRVTKIEPDEVITAISIPLLDKDEDFVAYKQAQRREDDIAVVNCAIYVNFQKLHAEDTETSKLEQCRMAFGGMAPTTVLALYSAKAIIGSPLDHNTIETVLRHLSNEMHLPFGVPGGMEKYRVALCLSFVFRFFTRLMAKHSKIVSPRVDNQTLGGEVGKADFDTHLQPYSDPSKQREPESFDGTQIYHDAPSSTPIHRPIQHLSADIHTTGEAKYTDDIPIKDCAHLCFVLSSHASALIISRDYSTALAYPGVLTVIDAADVPGTNLFGPAKKDTPAFATDQVSYFGQPVCAIVATDPDIGRHASRLVTIEYQPLIPCITVENAVATDCFHGPPFHLSNLDEPVDWTKQDLVLQGSSRVGGQEHFYLETQNCIAVPGEKNFMTIYSSTQGVTDVQHCVAAALGVRYNQVVVTVKRIGGGFGGKETAASIVAVPVAVAARKLNRPVRCNLERFEDMVMTGTRHPVKADWKISADATGKIRAFEVDYYANCGHSLDLSGGVLSRCVLHAENAYTIEKVACKGHFCKTNIQSSTAFRGFGAPQAMMCIEMAIEQLADKYNLDVMKVREMNLSSEGDTTYYGNPLTKCNMRRCWEECVALADYDTKRHSLEQFNKNHQHLKRGLAVIPTKFGVAFGLSSMNQAGALVHVYVDGSVMISHAGMEMGQGLHTKMAQIAAHTLSIDLNMIHIEHTSTDKVPNTSPTAASVGSDLNGPAVQNACNKILDRIASVRKDMPDADWSSLVAEAYNRRISLSATGFYEFDIEPIDMFNGKPQKSTRWRYYVYGVACTQVEVDTLTGDHKILSADIVMDIGDSLNPAIDIGQIEGAFMQGYGLTCLEELRCRPDGTWLTRGPSSYKIPTADNCPRSFNVKLLKGSSNDRAIFASKAVGEPPLFLGASAFFAIREAIKAARQSNGVKDVLQLDSPATAERIRLACVDDVLIRVGVKTREPDNPNLQAQPWMVQL